MEYDFKATVTRVAEILATAPYKDRKNIMIAAMQEALTPEDKAGMEALKQAVNKNDYDRAIELDRHYPSDYGTDVYRYLYGNSGTRGIG